ncbi:DUF927 domain-containing protein [Escherichia coli]
MKSAPNLKKQPRGKKHADTEVIIFAGSDAWAHAKQWQEQDGKLAGDKTPPVVLADEQLKDIGNLQIVPDGRKSARIYKAGHLDQVMVKGIGQKLAAAGVQDADYYPEGMHHNERQNWRNYLETERKNISDGLVIELPVKKKTSEQSEDELKPRVECRPDGVYWVTPKVDKQSGEIIRPCEWIGDRMRTVGIGHDGCDGYLIIELEPEGMEKIIYEAMPRNEIGLPSGWSRLRGRGVAVTTSQKLLNKLAEYLQREGERTQWEVTSTAGWHCGAYVMPDGEIIGVPERPVAFCGGSAAIKGYVVRGTADEWRDNVASLMRGNHSMMLGVLVGLAAPLNSLVGGGCFGVHLFAQSSAGKTTTVEAATSLYGDPEVLKLSWDATRYGLTVEAAARNDGFIPIDEIGQGGRINDIAQSAYSLFNGVGRIQGRKDGGNRAVIRWRIAALSTGEEDFETFLIKGGVTPKAGQLVRLLSVPFIDTTVFNGYDDGDQHARAIKRFASNYCGAAGREWIGWLSANKELAVSVVNEKENIWLSRLPENASPPGETRGIPFCNAGCSRRTGNGNNRMDNGRKPCSHTARF